MFGNSWEYDTVKDQCHVAGNGICSERAILSHSWALLCVDSLMILHRHRAFSQQSQLKVYFVLYLVNGGSKICEHPLERKLLYVELIVC